MLPPKQMLAATDCKKVSVIAAPSIVFPFESINGCLRTSVRSLGFVGTWQGSTIVAVTA